ncbi:MAG: glycosyltransferase [Acidobacteria bacterium]|nr:MAG: glycosyltransferase [Acidobacteriota bacterium]
MRMRAAAPVVARHFLPGSLPLIAWSAGFDSRPGAPAGAPGSSKLPPAISVSMAMAREERRRLVLLIDCLRIGGAERQLITLAQSLGAKGFEVIVITYRDVPADVATFCVPPGVQHVHVPGRGWNRKLLRRLRALQPAWICGGLPRANLRLVLYRPWLGTTRLIMCFRSCCRPRQAPSLRRRIMLRAEPVFLRWADGVIANSQAGRDLLACASHGRIQARVVPNGIDTERFRPDADGGRRFRQEHGIRDDVALIGIVARLHYAKHHELFLLAAAQMPAAVQFACIGGGPVDYIRELQTMAQGLGLGARVLFTGDTADMGAAYNALSLCTLCSRFEGLPNALAEAMACGVPCVGTEVGDTAALLGETGVTVPPDDAAALAKAWGTVLSWDRARAGQRARQRILDCYSTAALAQRTAAVLEAIR